jgi:3D (Asp-Asp-Asp) domain-containing protein
VKNKILKVLLAIAITINMGGAIYYNNTITQKNATISHLQDNVETKSTKIAKLGSVVKLKNEKIQKQQIVIDNGYKTINELKLNAKKMQANNLHLKALNFKKQQKGSDVGVSSPAKRQITVGATAYIAKCSEGCTGRTRTGVDVSNTIYYKGYRVIAVDTSVIPLNSLVKVETTHESFTAMAIDTGGGINGHEIDVLVGSTSKAREFGRQRATLTILREGK